MMFYLKFLSDIHFKINSNVNVKSFDFKRNKKGINRLFQVLKLIIKLRLQIVKSEPDVILSFMNKYNIATLIACFGLNQSVFISERDGYSEKFNKYFEVLRDYSYRLAKGIICQTNDSANFIKKNKAW